MRALVIAVWIVMVMMTGYALFHISFQVEALEGQLAELNQQIRQEQEVIHNLRAEWAYSSRPDWIETMGAEFLPDMHGVEPSQVLRIEDIPFRRDDPAVPETAALPAPSQPKAAEAAPASPSAKVANGLATPVTLVRTQQ